MSITIHLPNQESFERQWEEGITAEDLVREYQSRCPYQLLTCTTKNRNAHLLETIPDNDDVYFFDLRNSYGNMVYQSSLILLYLKAIKDVLGEDVKVHIANSLSKGVFTNIHSNNVNDETVAAIQARMEELVEKDVVIEETRIEREDVLKYLAEVKDNLEFRLFDSAKDLSHAFLAKLEDCESLFYVHIVPSAKYIPYFEIRRYRNGVLLRFPHQSKPDEVPEYHEQKQLYEAFSEETYWEHLMGVNYIADLNDKVTKGEVKELIMLSEALHEKKIAEIAEQIKEAEKRIVLIAGPSSSGKTSFAKRLIIQLQVIGLKPLYLGTDDYFIDRDDMTEGPDGKLDFESLSAVDIKLFTQQMNDLLEGKKVDIPEFDFLEGKKIFGGRITSIDKNQPIIIEGIHGLNPELTKGIEEDQKFKIYISPLTQINVDLHHRIPTTDARMLRRLVRDNRTRGRDALDTIKTWPEVRAGEEVNIFPYNSEADVFFNSQCLYELGVLKKYAKPLLDAIPQSEVEFAEAQRMSKFLDYFVSIEEEDVIPNNSIIREFIGGSILV